MTLGQEKIDVLLIPTRAWETWEKGAYKLLAEDEASFGPWEVLPIKFCRFRSRFGRRTTFAFKVEAKRMDYTAVIAKAVLDHFSISPAGEATPYRVDRMIMLGFCGSLKADEFKIGDIGIASQVDCYLEKAKIANIESIELGGEVYRTSQQYVRLGQNLRHLDPTGFEEFRTDCQIRRDRDLDESSRDFMDSESIGIHTPHLASATLLSTSAGAVKWLRGRDRKLFMIDMESGGMMAAVWAHNQNHPNHQVETIVIRAASDLTDENRVHLKEVRRVLQRHAVENVCRFLSWMFRYVDDTLGQLPEPPKAQVGIVVPLEEEFSYFLGQLSKFDLPVTVHYAPAEARFVYSFDAGPAGKCVCTFMGDMGLVQSALTTDALLNSCPGIGLLIQIGIAGSIDRSILVCDVAVATKVDPYLQGAESTSPSLGTFPPFQADPHLIQSIQAVFNWTQQAIRDNYAELRKSIECLPVLFEDLVRKPETLSLHCVPFASGDAVAADVNLHEILRSGERDNCVVDMESGGMHVAAAARCSDTRMIRTLFFRGISDNASADKNALDAIKPAGILRKVAMRNASFLVIKLLTSQAFWPTVHAGTEQKCVPNHPLSSPTG